MSIATEEALIKAELDDTSIRKLRIILETLAIDEPPIAHSKKLLRVAETLLENRAPTLSGYED